MAQQMYGRSREESYPPSYVYGQGSNLVPKMQQIVETKQAPKKPVAISYYPSSNTNNPQRVIAQVETVTREVVRNSGTVIDEPVREIQSHGDGQLKREENFINKLRDENIKATADLNEASRSIQPSYIEPKVLMSTNHDQLQLGHDLADPSHPRKVAELVNRVSNWRGPNGYDRGKPINDGYGYNKGYDQSVGYGGDTSYDNSHYGGYGSRNNNGWNKLPNSPQGYEQVGYVSDHTTNKISPSTKIQQGYDQYGHNEPRATNQGYGYGSEENGYGNRGRAIDDGYTRRNGVNQLAPVVGSGYSYTTGSTNKPLSKHEGYDQYGYNEPRVGYIGGGEGSIYKPVGSSQSGYGYGVGTRNGYNSSLPRSSYNVERPIGANSGNVITSVEAASKYKGTFVPR